MNSKTPNNLEKKLMEKQRPEIIIESAEPLTDNSSQSESEEEIEMKRTNPKRLNALSSIPHNNAVYIPKGMRPQNSTFIEQEEPENLPPKRPQTLNSLTHPLVLVAASIGIGILIAKFGVKMLKPAVEKVVEASENIQKVVEEID